MLFFFLHKLQSCVQQYFDYTAIILHYMLIANLKKICATENGVCDI